MGYAKFAYKNSSTSQQSPCGDTELTTNTESAIAWREFTTGQKASGCGQLGTIKQTSISLCQASCTIEPNCNTINFRADAERCELVNCAKPQSPAMIDAPGYATYSFGTVTTAPIVGWVIGKWGRCEQGGTNVTWGALSCDISQRREVRALGNRHTRDRHRPDPLLDYGPGSCRAAVPPLPPLLGRAPPCSLAGRCSAWSPTAR